MAGTAKGFNLPFDYVLYDMSYANVALYNATIPTYQSDKDKNNSKVKGERIKADDPRNKNKVHQFLSSIKD